MMDADWTLTEVVRLDAERTALYVLRNRNELHTATIEARPEFDPACALDDDDTRRAGWIRYWVTWSRSGSLECEQAHSFSLGALARLVSTWECRVSDDLSLADQIDEATRTTDRLHFAVVENVQWGIPGTRTRLREASIAYESRSRTLRALVDDFFCAQAITAPPAAIDFAPERAEVVMSTARNLLSA
jgi:hypothetical protein